MSIIRLTGCEAVGVIISDPQFLVEKREIKAKEGEEPKHKYQSVFLVKGGIPDEEVKQMFHNNDKIDAFVDTVHVFKPAGRKQKAYGILDDFINGYQVISFKTNVKTIDTIAGIRIGSTVFKMTFNIACIKKLFLAYTELVSLQIVKQLDYSVTESISVPFQNVNTDEIPF